MRALVVDDQRVNRLVLVRLLSELGYECFEATNGLEALSLFTQCSPDIVLMDVMMPVMDGYEATRKIKECVGDKYIPVIFLTAKSEDEDLIRCLECGGDDFLAKPLNSIMLMSKINAHARTQRLHNELLGKSKEIETLHQTLRTEHETGNHVLSHALSRNLQHSDNIRSHLVPQSTFNGDILLSAAKPFGGLYVFLGDITGHGLAAAIGTIPLSQVFFTMTKKGKSAPLIIREMNRSLRSFLPRSMFCAAVLLELDAAGKKAKVWSGGLPLCFHIQPKHSSVTTVPSKHLPLGVLENDSFDVSMQSINLFEGDSLLMMTDGIPESVNDKGEMFGLDRVEKLVRDALREPFESLLAEYKCYVGDSEQADDVSLVQVLAKEASPEPLDSSALNNLPWRTRVRLDSNTLKCADNPAADLLKLIPERLEFSVFRERIATVVTELFSNAFEHGLLKLDSQLKNSAEGFSSYYSLRQERLASLNSGFIEIEIAFDALKSPNTLEVYVKDSGDGFNHSVGAKNQARIYRETGSKSFGRGISLITSLCSSVEYNDVGNAVRAFVKLY